MTGTSVRSRNHVNNNMIKGKTQRQYHLKISKDNLSRYDVLRILPFVAAALFFFYYCEPHRQKPPPTTTTLLVKCLPLILLTTFVIRTSGRTLDNTLKKYVMFGLVTCCIGDALIVFPDYFIPALIVFAVGHAWYIKAFGYWHVRMELDGWSIAPITVAVVSYAILFMFMGNFMRVASAVYLAILCYMVLRATVRMKQIRSVSSFLTFLGAWSFGISDMFIGFSMWVVNFQGESLVIMVLYYIGQFLIAISILGF